MKKLFVSLSVVLSLHAYCQVDSLATPQTVTLTRLQHTYLIGFMRGNIQTSEKINYINQVRAGYDTTAMEDSITVTAPSSLIADTYRTMSMQPEGWTAQKNNEIKDALLPQLTNPWLLRKVGEIIAENDAAIKRMIEATKLFMLSIN